MICIYNPHLTDCLYLFLSLTLPESSFLPSSSTYERVPFHPGSVFLFYFYTWIDKVGSLSCVFVCSFEISDFLKDILFVSPRYCGNWLGEKRMGECLGRFESCWHIFKKTSSIEIGECWGESVCGVDFLRAGVGQVSPPAHRLVFDQRVCWRSGPRFQQCRGRLLASLIFEIYISFSVIQSSCPGRMATS